MTTPEEKRKLNRLGNDMEGVFAALGGIQSVQKVHSRYHLEHKTRLHSIESKLDGLETKLDGLETKFDELETKVDGLETKFDGLETKVDRLGTTLGSVEAKVEQIIEILGG
ncbi:MAG: hypothetical protein ACRC20_17730 [Segniliparus sp.]|uniref:hypothetical protein n=1 Tax=Segniliparus sp. TaxID=2804064 RepID=UPI003F3F79DD